MCFLSKTREKAPLSIYPLLLSSNAQFSQFTPNFNQLAYKTRASYS